MADSKSGMNLPSRTSAVLTDLRSGISGSIQDTARLKQEWTSLGQVIQTAGSRAGSLVKSGSGMQSSSKIAPDPNFGQQQQPSNNQVFSSPAQTAIGGGQGGGGQLVAPGGSYGGDGGGGGGGGGMFRNLSDYVSQNKTGAILYGAGTALMGAQSTSDMVEAQLLMQRNAAFMSRNPGAGSILDRISSTTDPFGVLSANGQGNLTNQYEYTRRSAAKMAAGGAANDPMDAYRAMAAGQSYGINSPNFMQRAGTRDQFEGSVMSGISNVSNLVPGMGLEGTTRAYGGMQRARSVNMLKGVGINIRDEQGNMKPMDVIIDDLWKKITRDVSKDGRGAITEEQMLIAFQPGNSMDSMVQNLFGDDPLVYTAIKNGLLYKARTGGNAPIDADGALSAGFTTKAVQTKNRKEALGTRGIGNVSNAGAASYGGVQGILNDIAGVALDADDLAGLLGPLKIFNSLAAMLQTAGGAGGGIGNSVMGFITALLGKVSGRAEGGSVGNKTPYIVGEQGPELFIPKTDGTIIPNMDGKNPFRHHGGSVKTTGPDMSKNEWAKALITKLGGSATEANTSAVISWMAQEGGHWNNSAGYNPLNTTRKMPGAKLMDGGPGRDHGVKHYTSWQQGLEATVLTLTEKAQERGYDKIVNSIISGKDQNRIMDAVHASKWGTGKGGGTSGGGTSGGGSNTQTDNPFKGTEFEKAYAEYLKTNTISDSTVSGLLKSGGTGAGNTGLSELFGSMAGGGSTVNYGGVTFNITTPADNKSFVDSIKKALGDLNLGKLIGNK
jgi:hypothetical protein